VLRLDGRAVFVPFAGTDKLNKRLAAEAGGFASETGAREPEPSGEIVNGRRARRAGEIWASNSGAAGRKPFSIAARFVFWRLYAELEGGRLV
jgi:hypothetical protein